MVVVVEPSLLVTDDEDAASSACTMASEPDPLASAEAALLLAEPDCPCASISALKVCGEICGQPAVAAAVPSLPEGCVPASGSNGVPLWLADDGVDDDCEAASDCK